MGINPFVPLYLGLDCGGSSCRALVLDDGEDPVFLAQGGSANLLSTRTPTLKKSLARALEGVPEIDAVCACFAGLIDEDRRRQGIELVREFFPAPPLLVEPDYAAALRACTDGTEICVIAGTGSIVCSRLDGALVKSGGGGYLLGDEGSGFRYGRHTLKAYLRDSNEVSAKTREAIERIFHTLEPGQIVGSVYESPAPGALVGSLAASLFRDAEQRFPYARHAIHAECRMLAEIVVGHRARYCPTARRIGLAGSVWKKAIVRESFADAMNELTQTDIELMKTEMPPVRGAALLARDFYRGNLKSKPI